MSRRRRSAVQSSADDYMTKITINGIDQILENAKFINNILIKEFSNISEIIESDDFNSIFLYCSLIIQRSTDYLIPDIKILLEKFL